MRQEHNITTFECLKFHLYATLKICCRIFVYKAVFGANSTSKQIENLVRKREREKTSEPKTAQVERNSIAPVLYCIYVF